MHISVIGRYCVGVFICSVVFQVYSKVTSIKLMNFGQIWS